MDKIKNTLKYFGVGFLVLLVTLCIYTFVVTDLMKKDYANVFGYTYFVVASGSMSGTIEVDDIIFVKITKNVKEGEIVTFKSEDGAIITHRLISKEGNNYITKGDVNNVTDEVVTKDQIIGKVTLNVSPSFILKSIAIFLILFIFLALFNFDKIIKKFVMRSDKESAKIPENIFYNPNRREEPSTGLTVTIALEDMEKIDQQLEKEELEKEKEAAQIEYLEEDQFLVESPYSKKNTKEKETVDLVISILKCKKNNVAKARMNKKWLTKYQYLYKLCHLSLQNNTEQLVKEIGEPPFKEIFDYDLERVGLTETIRNRIYELPLHAFLRILTYAILYNDDEMFDGIYKILKYKVMIDKENNFRQISKTDSYSVKQIKTLITFMKKVSNKFDNKNVFELQKIESFLLLF